ncbi:MAG: hypothetical protein ACRCW1_03705 [Anaerotignaceae bacterium]
MIEIFSIIRKEAEKFYNSTFNIYEFKATQGIINNVEKVCIVENIPCRIVFKSSSSSAVNQQWAEVSQKILLFTNPDIVIKEGSSIEVTSNAQVIKYKLAGVPCVYKSHQVVELIIDKKFA